jgi:hypothetical protein
MHAEEGHTRRRMNVRCSQASSRHNRQGKGTLMSAV